MTPDTLPLTRAVRFARGAAWFAALIGALSIVGWWLGITTLSSWRDDWPTVRPVTSVTFLFLGLALGLLSTFPEFRSNPPAKARRRLWARLAAGVVALVGLVTLFEYLFNWNPGIDRALFADALAASPSTHPGRMSLDSALALALVGVAMLLSTAQRAAGWVTATVSVLALAGVTLALSALSIFITPALGYESWLGATAMSLPSTLVLAATSAATFVLELQRRRDLWALGGRTAHAFGVSVVLMLATALTASRLQHQVAALGEEIRTLEDARAGVQLLVEGSGRSLAALTAMLADGDSAQRTVAITARALADTGMAQLRSQLGPETEPALAQNVARVVTATAQLSAWQDAVLQRPAPQQGGVAHRALMSDGWRRIQAQERAVHGLVAAQAAAIARREQQRNHAETRAYQAILLAGIASVGVILLALLGLNQTERQRRSAQRQLEESEFRWQFAIEGTGDGLWDVDVASGRVFYSAQVKRLLGYADHEMEDSVDGWLRLLHPDDVAATRKAFDAAIANGASQWEDEHRLLCGDGQYKWVRTRGVAVEHNPDGTPRRVIGTLSDVSVRHAMERDLAESEQRYRNLVETLPQAIFIHRQGIILFVNPAAVHMMRAASAADLVGTRLLERVHPDHRVLVAERLRRETESGAPAPLIEELLVRCDGSTFEAEVSGSVVFFDGAPALLASARDITVRKQAQQALRDSEARFHTVFNEAPLGIAVIDTSTDTLVDVNHRVEEILGCRREQLLGSTWMQFTHPDDLDRNVAIMEEVRAQRRDHYQLDTRLLRPDGVVVWTRIAGAQLSTSGTGADRHVAMLEDITALKSEAAAREQLEVKLNAAHRMEAVGRLAGGVAHDFNNMLGVILGTTDMAMRRLKHGDALMGDLREIQGAARRSADLTRQLLAFARRQVVAPTVLDMNGAVTGALTMLRRLIGEDLTLDWQPSDALWPVVLDASQLDQLLTNLVLNARHAITGVGTITIATENRVVDAEFCAQVPDAAPGEYACLTVRDTGSGMTREVQARIFEPFFTTKSMGEGTGLGLATVYGAVRQNSGFIVVQSTLGVGSTFDVYLPRHRPAPLPAPADDVAPARLNGTEKVLVVEDELTIMRMTVRMLESYGYDAFGLANPREAAALEPSRLQSFDLLLTDVVMPGLNGRELAATLTARAPRLKVLFMSGQPSDVMQQHGVLAEGVHFIPKPFTSDLIAAKVRHVLDSPV